MWRFVLCGIYMCSGVCLLSTYTQISCRTYVVTVVVVVVVVVVVAAAAAAAAAAAVVVVVVVVLLFLFLFLLFLGFRKDHRRDIGTSVTAVLMYVALSNAQ